MSGRSLLWVSAVAANVAVIAYFLVVGLWLVFFSKGGGTFGWRDALTLAWVYGLPTLSLSALAILRPRPETRQPN